MNILWITNTIFPDPSKALGLPMPVLGGWMYGLAEQLAATYKIQLSIATIYSGKELKTIDLNGIRYFLLPSRGTSNYQKHLEPIWRKICQELSPNVIHIHGTEFLHGLACMRSCPSYEYIISIQGLVGVCARYYYAGLTLSDIFKHVTLRDIVRFNTIANAKASFVRKGYFEAEYIMRTKHVIGRTSWDKIHTKTINPTIKYHFCNEILRKCFYSAVKWDESRVTKHSIFLSQASYPLKGLHQVLKAVAILKKSFPDIRLRVAGYSIINNSSLWDRVKISGYGSYISGLIKKLGLQDQLEFTGLLNEENMITEYQNAHLFICPSSIENSPNSIGEAQIIGVPVIASYVGGVPDMVTHGETGLLYRFEEVEMLAENIRRVFVDKSSSERISLQEIKVAEHRHNKEINSQQMIKVYTNILSD